MSADLFAEFGAGASSGQITGNQAASRPQTNSLIPDLESFSDTAFPDASHHVSRPMPHATQARTLPKQQTAFHQSSFPPLPQYDNGSDVLFDATLETASNDDSDDWGEFESADKAPTPPVSTEPVQRQAAGVNPGNRGPQRANINTTAPPKQLDLLDSLTLEDNPPAVYKQPRSASQDKAKPQPKKVVPTKPSAPTEEEEPFEEWGDFIDGPTTESAVKTTPRVDTTRSTRNSNTRTQKTSSQFSGVTNQSVHPSAVRPTNIPPPSVLLELFPQLFEQLRQEATQARRNLQQKESVDGAASSILCVLKAVARVVSGRTLRWKRDSILSQSMRIGPARSGKSGGMKLNTVNKNEDIKEKQEAVDVIVMWRDRAALFNSIIQASGRRPIQAIPENIRVTTATAEQGALKASHACALCGLKRDERLPRVDEAVEDSFGEWWTDHWGHTDCRQFWETHKDMLNQR
ncbi:uncharacterized protein LDX57_001037 [Aspergillus melleus]|uniref:uncharacterized protein n=1 Tax=Aspergillus melleus TaxID=138277 RepID=UPI001E8D271D|nr:uncharacterized protein LDX57_001037 [Aspergillus melleus]KAH8423279.1 hypothetical protein LDX57_001037 [Aspergillus melleus]